MSVGLRRSVACVAVLGGSLAVPIGIASSTPALAAGTACSAPVDTVAPSITSLTLSKATVDVTSKAASIAVSAQASDSTGSGVATGVDEILVFLTGPGRSMRNGTATLLRLVSGDDLSGTWVGTLALPRFSPAGTYNVSEVDAFDAAGNLASYSESTEDGEGGFLNAVSLSGGGILPVLRKVEAAKAAAASGDSSHTTTSHALPATTSGSTTSFRAASPNDPRLQPGWTTTVAVTSQASPVATTEPGGAPKFGRLTAFATSPRVLNTTSHSQQIRVTAKFAKHQPKYLEATFVSGNGNSRGSFAVQLHRSGSQWQGGRTVPQWVGRKTDHVSLYAEYVGGYSRVQSFPSDSLEHRGFTHVVQIVSRTDRSKPVLHSLTVSPRPINSQAGPATISVTAKLTDRGSGVAFAVVPFLEKVTEDGFTGDFPAGFVELHRSGGEWVGHATLHKCDPSGKLSVGLDASDVAGNELVASPSAIKRIGSKNSVSFVTDSSGDGSPEVSEVATGPQSIDIDFSQPVVGLSTSNLSLYDLTPASQQYRSTTAISGMTCYDDSATEPCDGSVEPISSATLDVATLSSTDTYEIWANLGSVVPQVVSTEGYPIPAVEAASQQFSG